ncbi:GNAT family N-acetyltransferase [Amycolatopsis sp. cmx-4-54]|uniref:GNAT family N-acetyltransferase n=1 Tax=Amycolatopsis sp. cmx-4-54 TaxID=2790936 RepID=UPI00397BF69C
MLERLQEYRPLAEVDYRKHARPWTITGLVCFVAWCEGEPVGFLSGQWKKQSRFGLEGPTGFIQIVGMLPDHRCDPGEQSSGARLVQAFDGYMASAGCSHLVLRIGATPGEETKTRAFFARQRFVPLPSEPDFQYRPVAPVRRVSQDSG